MPWLSVIVCDQVTPARRLLGLLLHYWRRRHTHIQGRAASWDSSGGENISRPGLRSCEPSGFRSGAWVCEFLSAQPQRERIRSILAWLRRCCRFLRVFQLWVQEGATQAALAKCCPRSVSKSFLHIGDVVVRRQDTSRARIQVVEPLVGDVRVA